MKTIASTKQLILKFSRKLVTPPNALRYLSQPFNPIYPKVKYQCENRDPNTLWWRVSVKDLNDRKRVVRSWCARRARMAFRQELKERGYDAEGRRLKPGTQDSATGNEYHGNLKGSMTILVEPACIQEKYSTVRTEMKTLMDALIQEQQKLEVNQRRGPKRTHPGNVNKFPRTGSK